MKSLQALARELRVWARLQHPNVLKLEGYHLDPKMTTAWFISPFLDHGNIKQYLAEVEGTTQLALKLVNVKLNIFFYLLFTEGDGCGADRGFSKRSRVPPFSGAACMPCGHQARAYP